MKDKIERELIDLTRKLIQFPTENPPGNEKPCIDYIEKWFEERGMTPKLVREPFKGRPQLVIEVGQGSPNLILNGHIDVVPAGDPNEWEHPPFKAEKEQGKVYGRGACDMKSNLALAMVLAHDLEDRICNDELEGSLTIQIAIGEETGEPGTKKLLGMDQRGDFGVVLEPTSMRTATAEKGLAWYEIEVEGKSSHASRPKEGKNPIVSSIPLLKRLEEYDEEIKEREHDLVGKPQSTVTKYESGTKENVIPDKAVITLDRRFLPTESIEDIDGEIEGILEDLSENHQIKTDWRRAKTYEPAEADQDNRLVETFRKNSERIGNIPSKPYGTEFSSDFRNFVKDAGIPSITWGPHDPNGAHKVDENIEIEDIRTGWKVLKKSVVDILSEG